MTHKNKDKKKAFSYDKRQMSFKQGFTISPNVRRAGSTLLGLFVAAITTTWDRCFPPSRRVKSWETILRSTSPCVCKNEQQFCDQVLLLCSVHLKNYTVCIQQMLIKACCKKNKQTRYWNRILTIAEYVKLTNYIIHTDITKKNALSLEIQVK